MNRFSSSLACAGCLFLGAFAASLQAQPDARDPFSGVLPFRYGTHAFRQIMGTFGLKALNSTDEVLASKEATVLIVLGKNDWITDEIQRRGTLNAYLQRGGAVLIATDRHLDLAAPFHVRVTGRRLSVEANSEQAYHRQEDFPFVIPTKAHRIFGNLKQIATNRPSFLEVDLSGPPYLADLPSGYITPGSRRSVDRVHFAAGAESSHGRVLFLADHSVFINMMMLPADNDNLLFAFNVIDWLTESGKRNRVLFIDEEGVQTQFDNLPLEELELPPLPPLNAFVPLLNKALKGLEEENAINRLFDRLVPRQTRAGELIKGLVLLLTFMLIFYGFLRLGHARQRIEPGSPLLATTLVKMAPAGGVIQQRNESMLREGNLWEPARTLTRQTLSRALDYRLDVLDMPVDDDESALIVRAQGSWWQRWRLRREIRGLWRLAYGTDPVRVTPRQFTRLRERLRELETAVASGKVSLGFRES